MKYILNNPKRFLLLFFDAGLIGLAYVGAYLLRFELTVPSYVRTFLWFNLPLLLVLRLLFLVFFGVYRGIARYASIGDLKNIALALFVSSGFFVVISRYLLQFEGHPRSIYLIDLLLAFIFIGGSRVSIRLLRDFQRSISLSGLPLLIVGAGDAGELLIREIHKRPEAFNYIPRGLVDDDPGKKGTNIHGVPVLGNCEQIPEIVRQKGIAEIIIAVPSASGKQMRRMVNFCKLANVKFKTIPSLAALVEGSIRATQIREVSVEDLLRREPAVLDTPNIEKYIRGKRIMVTGAGGSIGSELCRQVARYQPQELILLERAENSLFYCNAELRERYPRCKIAALVGDIIDEERVKEIFKIHCPQVVFHAAAHKHVPLMEENPKEAIKNNVLGTLNLLEVAAKFDCLEEFVFISTDKAVKPTSIMGASKRIAEMMVTSYKGHNKTKFCAVRFGNVIGSEGSVLPIFKKQIEKGGPVTVTHPEITRYFMTIPEAAQLVLQAGAMAQGGEVFILEMGEPIKIADLAKDLITFSGLKPGEDIDIIFTGLRAGEKMYEELWEGQEKVLNTAHEKIKYIIPEENNLPEFLSSLNFLEENLPGLEVEDLVTWMVRLVPEFQPSLAINKDLALDRPFPENPFMADSITWKNPLRQEPPPFIPPKETPVITPPNKKAL